VDRGRIFLGGVGGLKKKLNYFRVPLVIPRGGHATILVWKQGASAKGKKS